MSLDPHINAKFQTPFVDGLDLIPKLMHKAFEDRRAGYQPPRHTGGVDPYERPYRPVDTPRGGVSQGLYAPTAHYRPPASSSGELYTREGGPAPELGRTHMLATPLQASIGHAAGATVPSRQFRREKRINENQHWPDIAWYKPGAVTEATGGGGVGGGGGGSGGADGGGGGGGADPALLQQLSRKMTGPHMQNFHKLVHDARTRFDLDRSGKLTYREFYAALNRCCGADAHGTDVTPDEFQRLVRAYDRNGTGYVPYEQVAADLARQQGPGKQRDFHAERVRDQIKRGGGLGFNHHQVGTRQLAKTIAILLQ
jgi:hypothetical protein